jgi:hypothetical protein
MITSLTSERTTILCEQLAQWAVSLRIGTPLAFLLEVNRPLAPLSANACIAAAPLAAGLLPLHDLGLLLQDNAAITRVCARIRQLEREQPSHAVTTLH